jgi:hypothetical protein
LYYSCEWNEAINNTIISAGCPVTFCGHKYMKKEDLVATLVWSRNKICMAVLEVKGFQFLKEKVARTIAALDDLENANNQIKISGQIIDLLASSSSSWEWTKKYLSLDNSSQDKKLTHCQFVFEIPSCLAHPLAY